VAVSDFVLYRLARNWPSPVAGRVAQLGAEAGTEKADIAYAQHQFDRKVRLGLGLAVTDLDVLEIGCGHGGISCYLASVGARRVVGIDVNAKNLGYATRLVEHHARRLGGAKLPLHFAECDARKMCFADGSFDMVVADNLFEHVMDPMEMLTECRRVLRPGGQLVIPLFSSIYSKFGLHLKHGLKLPWANVVFSEATILRAMQRLARENPRLYEIYPGLANNPKRVRDVRRYGDLNSITYKSFKRMARESGFQLQSFRPVPTLFGIFVRRLPVLRRSIVMDVLSTGASAVLRKP